MVYAIGENRGAGKGEVLRESNWHPVCKMMRKTVKNQSGIVVLLVHGMHIRIRRAKKFLFEYADIKPEGRTGVFGCNAIDFIWNPELDVGAHGVSEYDLGSWSKCYIKFVEESNACVNILEVVSNLAVPQRGEYHTRLEPGDASLY